jgi:hypothetical protein
MHRFPAELFGENLSVLLIGEHEHLVVFMPPNNGVSMPRERKFPILAKSPKFVEVLAGAILFRERHPVGKIVVRRPEYSAIDAHQR